MPKISDFQSETLPTTQLSLTRRGTPMPRELTFTITLEVRSKFNSTNAHLIVNRTASGKLPEEGPAKLLRLALADMVQDLEPDKAETIKARFDELLAEVKADREALKNKAGVGGAMERRKRYYD
jgi:hypothetical protein